MRLRTPLLSISIGAAALFAGGCGKHLVYVHSAVIGIDVTVASEGTQRIQIGYDTETFAVVPTQKEGEERKVMNLVAVSHVDSTGLNELIFNHALATGDAAKAIAKNEEKMKELKGHVKP